MNSRALMRKEEENFLRAAQRVLLQGGFPNPERTGCPSRALLKAIAYREVIEGDTALADLLEEWFALGLMAPIPLYPLPVCVMPS